GIELIDKKKEHPSQIRGFRSPEGRRGLEFQRRCSLLAGQAFELLDQSCRIDPQHELLEMGSVVQPDRLIGRAYHAGITRHFYFRLPYPRPGISFVSKQLAEIADVWQLRTYRDAMDCIGQADVVQLAVIYYSVAALDPRWKGESDGAVMPADDLR